MFLQYDVNFLWRLALQGKKKNLMTARVSMLLKLRASLTCFRACFLPGRAKDLSAPRYFASTKYQKGRSRWPCRLRCVRLLACWDCGFEFLPWYGCLSLVTVVRYSFLGQADHSSRGVPLSVACLRRGLHYGTNATRQHVQSPASESASSKLAMPTTRREEKAGQQPASSAAVHHSTSQR